MDKSPRPRANPNNRLGNAASREAQDARDFMKPSSAPKKSPRPRTKSDFEIDHAIKQSVKYQKDGGKVSKMASGGMCRGMGAATKGGSYKG